MTKRKVKLAKDADPTSLTAKDLALRALDTRGEDIKWLAEATGFPYYEVLRYLNIGEYGGYKKWSINFAVAVSKALDIDLRILLGMIDTKMGPQKESWKPLTKGAVEGEMLYERFADFEKKRPTAPSIALHRFVPTAIMTSTPQRLFHLAAFDSFPDVDRDRLCKQYNSFGDARRDDFFNRGIGTRVLTMMPRDGFEDFVYCRPPCYHMLNPSIVLNVLDYIYQDCVDRRDFRLLLVDNNRLTAHQRFSLCPYECVFIIGGSIVVRRLNNLMQADWSELPEETGQTAQLLQEVAKKAALHDVTKSAILRVLDKYRKEADDALRSNADPSHIDELYE